MSCVQSFYGALKIFHGPFISIVQILFFSTWHTGKNPLIDNIKKNSRIVAYLKRIFKIEIYATRQGPKLLQTKERVSASFSSVFKGDIQLNLPNVHRRFYMRAFLPSQPSKGPSYVPRRAQKELVCDFNPLVHLSGVNGPFSIERVQLNW